MTNSPAVSPDWEGAFLSEDEVELATRLIADWMEHGSGPLEADRAKLRALGRRLGMPDMAEEDADAD